MSWQSPGLWSGNQTSDNNSFPKRSTRSTQRATAAFASDFTGWCPGSSAGCGRHDARSNVFESGLPRVWCMETHQARINADLFQSILEITWVVETGSLEESADGFRDDFIHGLAAESRQLRQPKPRLAARPHQRDVPEGFGVRAGHLPFAETPQEIFRGCMEQDDRRSEQVGVPDRTTSLPFPGTGLIGSHQGSGAMKVVLEAIANVL